MASQPEPPFTRLAAALGPIAGRVGAATREAARRAGPWLRYATAVLRAALGLGMAEARYRATALARRAELERARLAHALACRRARRRLRSVEQEAGRRVAGAEKRFRTLAKPVKLADYGPFSLLDESLKTPDWEASLQSVRAVLLPRQAAALKEPRTMRAFAPMPDDPPRGRDVLVLRSKNGVSAYGCPSPDDAVEFARLVNVTALNSSRLSESRRDELNRAAGDLEAVRAEAVRMIAEARRAAEAVVSDTADVQAARALLDEARADTRVRDDRRAALAAVVASRPRPDA